jgi:hypothetical protein
MFFVEVSLQYGKNRATFYNGKNMFFCSLKPTCLEQFLSYCKLVLTLSL